MIQVPELKTQRLVLRAHRPAEDFEKLAAMWGNPDVVRYVGGKVLSREDVFSKMLRSIGHWQVRGYGYWVVCTLDGSFVGEVGFADMLRDIEPQIDGVPEAGWVLVPPAHGRGYATEAVTAAQQWLDSTLNPSRTVCLIDLGNDASVKVAKKCGFREWCLGRYHGAPVNLFER